MIPAILSMVSQQSTLPERVAYVSPQGVVAIRNTKTNQTTFVRDGSEPRISADGESIFMRTLAGASSKFVTITLKTGQATTLADAGRFPSLGPNNDILFSNFTGNSWTPAYISPNPPKTAFNDGFRAEWSPQGHILWPTIRELQELTLDGALVRKWAYADILPPTATFSWGDRFQISPANPNLLLLSTTSVQPEKPDSKVVYLIDLTKPAEPHSIPNATEATFTPSGESFLFQGQRSDNSGTWIGMSDLTGKIEWLWPGTQPDAGPLNRTKPN